MSGLTGFSTRSTGAPGKPARQRVLEKLLDEISFSATDRGGETYQVDADLVREKVGDLAKDSDLTKFIL